MRTFFILTVIFTLNTASAFAQDVLKKTSGLEIQTKILEIGAKEIRYKMYDNPDGPVHVINRSEVYTITYANGTKEVITSLAPQSPQASAQPENMRIEKRMNGYYHDGIRVSKIVIRKIILESGNAQATAEINKGYKTTRTGKVLIFTGIPLIAGGAVVAIFGTLFRLAGAQTKTDNFGNEYETSTTVWQGEAMQVGGAIAAGLGIATLTTGIIINGQGKRKIASAIEMYNSGLEKSGHLKKN